MTEDMPINVVFFVHWGFIKTISFNCMNIRSIQRLSERQMFLFPDSLNVVDCQLQGIWWIIQYMQQYKIILLIVFF
jgi:hypothetical protein